jgi:phospholipid/cholesterol/gamma-HCH transport system substrate-binding protein
MAEEARQGRRPLYGGLLITAVVGFAVLIFFLDDIFRLFERSYEIVALVPDAPGLAAGAPVWVGGKPVGEVRHVAVMPAGRDTLGRVLVLLELPRHVQSQVRTDSRVRLTAARLVGERVVDILPGSPAAPVARAGDTLRLAARPTMQQVTGRAAVVRAELDTLTAALQELAPQARARLGDAQRTFAALDAAMAQAQQLRTDLQANPGLALLRDQRFRASLERARQSAAALPGTFDVLRERSADTQEVAAAFARLQDRADTLAARIDAATSVLDDRSGGSLARLLDDDALLHALHAARAALDSLLAEARSNPLRFVF